MQQAGRNFAELGQLLQKCNNHTQEPRPLNLISLFALRSLVPRWKLDGRKQDAAEFPTSLIADNLTKAETYNLLAGRDARMDR